MTAGWQQILSTETAQGISKAVCWEDSSLTDAVFCRTAFTVQDGSRVSGYGLRVLVDCCSAPASHLELCFLDITEPVEMPIDFDSFEGFLGANGQFRFTFSCYRYPNQCRAAYFRFIELEARAASSFYRSPAILDPAGDPLVWEGCSDSPTADGGHIVVSGEPLSPKLFIQPEGQPGCEVQLDQASSLCLLNAIHHAANS